MNVSEVEIALKYREHTRDDVRHKELICEREGRYLWQLATQLVKQTNVGEQTD